MQLILEDLVFDEGKRVTRLASIAKSLGHEAKIIHALRELPSVDFKSPAIFYGSINGARRITKPKFWGKSDDIVMPGIIGEWNNFRCTTYYNHLGPYLLNRTYVMAPLREIFRMASLYSVMFHSIGESYSDDGLFIRPDDPYKSFTGQLVGVKEPLDRFMRANCLFIDEPDKMAVASGMKRISAEYRLFIKDSEIITGCQYSREGDSHYVDALPECLLLYVRLVLDSTSWRPARLWVMDIGVYDGRYSVLEIGLANCCDLYVCNEELFVRALLEVALDDWNDSQS
jgi:hypothetical protein